MKKVLFAVALSFGLLSVTAVNAQDKKAKPTPAQADKQQMQKEDRPLVNGTVNDKTITPVNGQQMNGNAAQFDADQRTTDKPVTAPTDTATMVTDPSMKPIDAQQGAMPKSSTESRPDMNKSKNKSQTGSGGTAKPR